MQLAQPTPSASHPRSKERLVGPESPEKHIANTGPGNFPAFIRLEGSQAILESVLYVVKQEKLGLDASRLMGSLSGS